MSWTITADGAVSVAAGAQALFAFTITSTATVDRTGTVTATVTGASGVTSAIENPTRRFAAGGSRDFSTVVTVPAGASPGLVDLIVTVTAEDGSDTASRTLVLHVAHAGAELARHAMPTQIAHGVAVGRDGRRTYATMDDGTLWIFEPDGPATVQLPLAVAYRVWPSADETRACVLGALPDGRGALCSVDLISHATTPLVQLGTHPVDVAVRPDARVAYVASTSDPALSVVDLVAGSVAHTAPLSISPPRLVAATADGRRVYVLGAYGQVSVFDATTDVVGRAPETFSFDGVGFHPVAMALSHDGTRLAAVSEPPGPSWLTVLDTTTLVSTTFGTIVGASADRVAVDGNGRRVWVIGQGVLAEVDAATRAVTASVALGVELDDLAVDRHGFTAHLSAYDGGGLVLTIDLG